MRSENALSLKSCVIFFVFAAALLFAYYAPALSGQADFYLSDCSHYFEPLCRFVSVSLKEGNFPLWNPLLYCGMSQAAIPSPSLFHPASYLLFFLPFSRGLAWYMILQHLLLSSGTFLYLSCLRFSRTASLFAALSALLSSYFFCLSRNPTLPATVAVLPLALFCQRQISLERGRLQCLYRVSFALLVGLTVAGGRPELILPCLLLMLSDGVIMPLFQLMPSFSRQKTGVIGLRFLLLILGLGLSAPVFMPALEWSALSPRAHGLETSNILSWSAGAYEFASMLLSYPLGDLCDLSKRSEFLLLTLVLNQDALPFLSSSYLGPVVIVFGLFALLSAPLKEQRGMLFLLLVFALLSAGSNAFLLPVLLKVFPLFSMIRYPVKFLILTELLLILAASWGFDRVLKKQVSVEKVQYVSIAFALLFLLASAVMLVPGFKPFVPVCAVHTQQAQWLAEANLSIASNLLAASAEALLVGILTIAVLKDNAKKSLYASTVILLLCINAFLSANTFPLLSKKPFYSPDSKLFLHLKKFLKEDKDRGEESRILPLYTEGIAIPAEYRKDDELGFPEKYHSYLRSIGKYNSAMDFMCPQSYGYEAAATGVISRVFKEAQEHSSQYIGFHNHPKSISDLPLYRFCKLSSTRYVLTQGNLLYDELPLPQLDERYFELFGQSKGNNSRIYRSYDSYPRLCFAEKVILVSDWKKFEEELSASEPMELDKSKLKLAYLLASDPKVSSLINEGGIPLSAASNGRVLSVKDSGQELIVKLSCPQRAILLLSDQYYPGWHAYLDGKEVPIIRANLFTRAFVIEDGEHELKLVFMPDSLNYGFVLSALSFLFVLLASFVSGARTVEAEGETPESIV